VLEIADKEPIQEQEVSANTRCWLETPRVRFLQQKEEAASFGPLLPIFIRMLLFSLLSVNSSISCQWKALLTFYIPSAGPADRFVLY